MTFDLTTTNRFLGVLAMASVLEVIAIAAVCVGVLMVVRRVNALIESVEKNQLAPASARVHDILDDVRSVTSTIRRLCGIKPAKGQP